MAEPSIENVENRLAAGLNDAFLEAFLDTFLETFFKGEFFEESDVGMVLSGRRCWSCFLNWSLRSSGKGINQSIR